MGDHEDAPPPITKRSTPTTTTRTGCPPARLVVCTTALAAIHQIAARRCRGCARVARGERPEDVEAMHPPECVGVIAWRAIVEVTGLRR